MPGTSEVFEIKNFDGVANKLVAPIRLLLNSYPLEQHVCFRTNGIPEAFKHDFRSVTDSEWDYILDNVIFSKVTSLEINASYSIEQIESLLKLLNQVFVKTSTSRVAPEDLPEDFVIAKRWLKKTYEILNKKQSQKVG